jgi:TolA-binding protein
MKLLLRCLSLVAGLLLPLTVAAESAPAFLFERPDEPLTIGDIKPSFLIYSEKELPDVSIQYVLKRYQKLFESATSPDVRLDVVNRINNLCEKHSLSCSDISMNLQQQNELIIDSASAIMDKGIFYQRMDELLYTWAKALHFMGRKEEAVQRLKMVSGLYPRSALIDEVRFRMAEAYFDLQQFAEAEAAYKSVISFNKDASFQHRARFKLGWSVFRQDRFADAAKYAVQVLDAYPPLQGQTDLSALSGIDQELAEDTLRLLAIMFARQDGAKTIEALQKSVGHQHYAYLLYDSLLRLLLKQDRFEDAAVVAASYPVYYPDRFDAWTMAQHAIRAYRKGNFDIKEWQAKEDFVANFGVRSHFWRQRKTPEQEVIRPHLVAYLQELAHLYYIRMQQTKDNPKIGGLQDKAKRASAYYLELADTTTESARVGDHVFLAAEALYTANDIAAAIPLYEHAAFKVPLHANSARAGYAAITSYDLLRAGPEGSWTAQLANARVAAIESFSSHFTDDPRTPALLNVLASEVFELEQFDYAEKVATRVLAYPKLAPEVRYSSSLVLAHSLFALDNHIGAEQAYQRVLEQPASARDRKVLRERLAASIYRQAELEPNPERSAALYLKVVDTVPEASFVAQAVYDASAQYLKAANWGSAIATLHHFQQAWPDHELYDDATDKLVHAYMQNGEKLAAAEKLVEVSRRSKDQEKSLNALFQAADMYREGDFSHEANRLYEQFIERYPDQFALVLEAYHHVIRFHVAESKAATARDWKQRLIAYEAAHSAQRNDRSAWLAADASFDLAMERFDQYAEVRLTLPLKKSLASKKKLLQDTIQAFGKTAEYGVSEFLTASTYRIGTMYQLMAKDIMNSERPKELDELEREQYDILLEEQAFGFEEQAMEVFRINLARGSEGVYDDWVRKTFATLATMNPAEYLRETKRVSHAEAYF